MLNFYWNFLFRFFLVMRIILSPFWNFFSLFLFKLRFRFFRWLIFLWILWLRLWLRIFTAFSIKLRIHNLYFSPYSLKIDRRIRIFLKEFGGIIISFNLFHSFFSFFLSKFLILSLSLLSLSFFLILSFSFLLSLSLILLFLSSPLLLSTLLLLTI